MNIFSWTILTDKQMHHVSQSFSINNRTEQSLQHSLMSPEQQEQIVGIEHNHGSDDGHDMLMMVMI